MAVGTRRQPVNVILVFLLGLDYLLHSYTLTTFLASIHEGIFC